MKWLFALTFISFTANSAILGQLISQPDGSSVQQFQISSNKVTYEKRSNFFDKKTDLSLGKFSTNYKVTDKEQNKISTTLSKIKVVDEVMKKKSSSFNDLSTKEPHASFLMLDDFRISKESDLYPEMKTLYETLAKQEWKQESGIRLSKDYKSLIQIKDGKEVSREPFNFPFHCQKPEPPTQCAFKDYGILYLPK